MIRLSGLLSIPQEMADENIDPREIFEFARRKNVERFRRLLTTIADESERKRVLKLLDEQEARKQTRERGDAQ